MTDRATLESAALVIIRACRERLIEALLPVIQAEGNRLQAEGHAEALVCQAMVSASAELLGHMILDNADPADAVELWQQTAETVADFVRKNAELEAALPSGVRAPVSATLQ